MDFGKNRLQYQINPWFYYRYEKFDTYFYTGGKELAVYTAQNASSHLKKLEALFDYELKNNIQFIIYNKQSDFRQSNIGISADSETAIGGVTQIVGTKVFLYFEGDHVKFDQQIKAGIAQVLINEMLYGWNWKEALKNNALLKLPDWYLKGLIMFASSPWNTDAENIIKDGLKKGRYKRFNLLSGKDAEMAGFALWNYISKNYGENVLSNILYMTKVSRNTESGFLFVLGSSLVSINQEWQNYYTEKFALSEINRITPDKSTRLKLRTKKHKVYSQFRINNDASKSCFVSNELGKCKVYVYDMLKNKKKLVYKFGQRLNRIPDYSYPLLNWHPNGTILAIITEREAKPVLLFYDLNSREFSEKPIFQDKVLWFDYSDDGKQLVFSAVTKGQSDIFVYNIAANTHRQITNDLFDDLYPKFTNNSNQIVFSSNRNNDTLSVFTDQESKQMLSTKDLFAFDLNQKNLVLRRITNTPLIDEVQTSVYDQNRFSYLSNVNGVKNRFVAQCDSSISYVDTMVHYSYQYNTRPQTNFSRNILDHQVNIKSRKIAQLFFIRGKNELHTDTLITTVPDSIIGFNNPPYFNEELPVTDLNPDLKVLPSKQVHENNNDSVFKTKKNVPQVKPAISSDTIPILNKKRPRFKTVTLQDEMNKEADDKRPELVDTDTIKEKNNDIIDIDDYQFSEKNSATDTVRLMVEKSDLLKDSVNGNDSIKEFVLPTQRNYNIVYFNDYVVTQLDNNFLSQSYQRYTGGGSPVFQNSGLNGVMKFGISDLFENKKIVGGLRISPNLTSNEYFLSYEDLTNRIDQQYIFHRMSQQQSVDQDLLKIHTNEVKYITKYPLSEVAAFKTTLNFRHDNLVVLSSDRLRLQKPNTHQYFANVKAEYIFDNTLPIDLNLMQGTRLKIFAEHYRDFNAANTHVSILGADYRNYFQIFRGFIWANRLASSTSFGPQRLLYYLGGVDGWMFPKYDNTSPVDKKYQYVFQALATNMRGFYQNARNGNSFAVLNSELRMPVFKLLVLKPIKSDFIRNFMLVGFADAGSAWNGLNPSQDNNLSTRVIYSNPFFIQLKNQKSPVVYSYGWGLRSTLWGYYIRADWAWGINNGLILPRIFYLSLNMDF